MFLLLLLVLVAVGVAGAGALGLGALSADRRRQRTGLLAALSAPAVLLVGVVLLAAILFGIGGRQGGDQDGQDGRPSPAVTTTPVAGATDTVPPARVQPVARDVPVIGVFANQDGSFAGSPAVGELVPGAAVRVVADGFGSFEAGRAEQCVVELGRRTACAVAFPVQFDENGHADFLFLVHGEVAPGGCRVGQPTCLLRVTGADSRRQGEAQTVMGDRVIPGVVTVSPEGGLAEGGTAAVTVTGFPAGTPASVVLCAPPAGYDPGRCSAPLATFTVGSSGSGRTNVVLSSGPVGADRVPCGGRARCGVVVLSGQGYVTAPVVPVTFAAGPGVGYAADRVLTGLLVAVVLLGLATAIALRTDWTKPTEAATPEMDRADLRADESLDDLFGSDEELDARDPIPW